jgi:hypothetical protein
VTEDDPDLPALRAEAQHGELVSHRPAIRAVVRADGYYIKVFRPGEAVSSAERCALIELLMDGGPFVVPRIIRSSPDVIAFSCVPGRTLGALAEDRVTTSDTLFARLWEQWSHAWTDQVQRSSALSALASLPTHAPQAEAADLWRWVNRWSRHFEGGSPAQPRGDALRSHAESVTRGLIGSAPDPLVWAHGDLHDKQILAAGTSVPLGLLDFDDTAQAEPALDLANLDVHLELHTRRNRMAPARFCAAHTQVMAAAKQLNVNPERFQTYSDAVWLRLACSPLPVRSALSLAVLDERAAHRHLVPKPTPPAAIDSSPVGSRGS